LFLGEPSIDSRARFNLSPVPSVENDDDNDDDDGVSRNMQRGLPNIDQDDVGEETELVSGPPGSTTTVQMFDKNRGVSGPSANKRDNQG
jgi:hypothetical protein